MVFNLLDIHIRSINGYMLKLCNLEIGGWEGSLFAINFCKDFFYMDLFFFPYIKVFDKTSKL